MVNYSQGKIYKIVHNSSDNLYIGSTCEKLSRRMSNHRCDSNKPTNNMKIYKFIHENGGWINFRIILIQLWPCNSVDELRQREQYHIDLLKPTLNGSNSFGLNKEHKKEFMREYNKNYYIANAEKIKEKKRIQRD